MTPAAATTDPRPRPAKFHEALEAPFGALEPEAEPDAAGSEVWVTGAVGSVEATATEVADSYACEAASGSAMVLSKTESMS
jgi:hypothetical protein